MLNAYLHFAGCRRWALIGNCLAALWLAPGLAPAQAVVSTLAGTGTAGRLNGPGATAQFNIPRGLTVDARGNVYVADTENHLIRKISPAGVVSTIAGTGSRGYANAANPLSAAFARPRGLALDPAGNLYIADSDNAVIRRLDAATGAVTTVAGNGYPGYLDAPGTIAEFRSPTGIVRDAAGNLYIGDTGNFRVRKIDAQGNVTTLAGTSARGYQDGPAATARFFGPQALALDGAGNLLIADVFGHRLRMLSPAGMVSTVAGTGSAGYTDGAAAMARFTNPQGVAVDSAGAIYVSDSYGYRIRRIHNGQVSTVAGTGIYGYTDGPAATAQFTSPGDLHWDTSTAHLYIADVSSNRIRQLNGLVLAAKSAQLATARLQLYPNPAKESVQLAFETPLTRPARVELFDALGRRHGTTSFSTVPGQNVRHLSLTGLPAGFYLCRLTLDDITLTQRLCIEP